MLRDVGLQRCRPPRHCGGLGDQHQGKGCQGEVYGFAFGVRHGYCGTLSARIKLPALMVLVLFVTLLRNVSEMLPALVPATT